MDTNNFICSKINKQIENKVKLAILSFLFEYENDRDFKINKKILI